MHSVSGGGSLKEIVRILLRREKSLPFSGERDKKGEEICMDKRILNEGGREERSLKSVAAFGSV